MERLAVPGLGGILSVDTEPESELAEEVKSGAEVDAAVADVQADRAETTGEPNTAQQIRRRQAIIELLTR